MLAKEWAKLRLYGLLLLLASTGWALYLVLRLRRLYAVHDAEAIWITWITKGYLFLAPYQYVPLVTGVLIGVPAGSTWVAVPPPHPAMPSGCARRWMNGRPGIRGIQPPSGSK